MYMLLRVHVLVCTHVSAHMCMSRHQRLTLGVFPNHSAPYILRRGLSVSLELTDSTGLAACEPQRSICPNTTSPQHWNYGNLPLSPAFHVNAREPNTQHQACMVNISPSKPYPHPLMLEA